MAVNNVQFFTPQQLGASVATYYTTPTNRTAIITRATFCNVSANTVTITAHIVPSGGIAEEANKIIDAFALDSDETFSSPDMEGQVLPEQTTLQLLASAAASVNVIFSGVEIV